MKLPWDKKHISWGITAFLTISASVLFYVILQKWESFSTVFGALVNSLSPITYGLILAYLLNPLLNIIEHSMIFPICKKVFRKNRKLAHSMARGFSIILSWVIAILFIVTLFALVLPEIYKSIESLIELVPKLGTAVLERAYEILDENPEIIDFLENFISGFTTDFAEIMARVQELIPNLNIMISGLTDSVYALVTAFFNILIGIIVSVYVLKDKERFVAQFKRLFYSIMPTDKANNVIAFFRLTHDKFGNFIAGKILDSLIIGVICYISLIILNMPYAALVSVIVGVTNVIPFFGPFIGAVPSAILILFVDPVKCLTFVIFVIVLQQFDGNILGPKILGSTTGLSSFWVMFAILVGSGMFGVWGMICSVPLLAVIFTLSSDGCHVSLRKKGIDYNTETFERIDHIDETTNTPVWMSRD